MSTTRFPSGVSNAALGSALTDMGQLDPTKFHTFFNDFDTYNAADWIVTEVGLTTQALTAGDGGLLLVTNTAAAPDSTFMQNAVPSFLLTAGKRTFFKARMAVSDAVQSILQLGLIVADTTPLDATDGIYFMKDDGDAQIDIYVRKDATTGSISSTNVATLVAATQTVFGFVYDGKDSVKFYVNEVHVASLSAAATYRPDAALAISFGVGNGEAVAKTLTVDYIFAAQER